MKITINILITLIVLLGLSLGFTYLTHAKFIDYSFLVGMIVSIIIWFSTSKGGFTSRLTDMTVQGTTGIKMEEQTFEFKPTIAFITSLSYTIITFVVMLFHYRNYF
ncbi:hypothetical protein [Bacillus sp. USDA818B3_A]|uniref:hypothetical protein n=1 Tax=Bacillus sp. USDA818B3_A TaxID=2698834 RepID=UPI00136F9147|nr:hypothetical protein [Bacillus sp. USDA818B3_A]